ncbi:hypothetical protein EUTSA_v10011789mg [Eutrema salsugineum]|uniref:Cyclin-dependent kinase inhibitor n=1 Tax=Eutrema salsugineum TaxID=72664 RepID=V4KH81_EUTSA|nr:cyclin-dependent kinase inhibitor 7 [Eutrema salsugineum]ESQ30519.1 hypothetical protein EUTSA_v10011789mg [Eutrema salsugineum]
MNEMSERKPIMFKRNSGESELEGSNIKKIRLDDDDDLADSEVLRSLERTFSSSLAYSASDSGGFSAEDDHRSSSVSTGCSSSETNEIASDTRLPFLDLEAQQISEAEISTLGTNNFREEGSQVISEILGETAEMDSATTERRDDQRKERKKTEKSPTQAELDDFFSAAERFEQKRFTEKYNYDIVNDTPLEGRYQWVSLKP